MGRQVLNFLVDAAALAAFLLLLSTGALIRWVLPPGSGHSLTLWGMDRHGWGSIHFWLAVAFLALTALHLVLHWAWISCMIRWRPDGEGTSRRDSRIVPTLVLLFLIALFALAPFFGRVKRDESRRGRGHDEHASFRLHSPPDPAYSFAGWFADDHSKQGGSA